MGGAGALNDGWESWRTMAEKLWQVMGKRCTNDGQTVEDCLDGAVEKGIICGTGAWKSGDIKKSAAMQQAYEMGKNV